MWRYQFRLFLFTLVIPSLLCSFPQYSIVLAQVPQTPGPAVYDSGALIHQAARTGDLELLRSELRRGVSPNIRDESGRTPLVEAVSSGHVEGVRLLLRSGADVNARTKAGGTALVEAAALGHLAIARELVKSGADLNVKKRGLGTALEAAERGGHNQIAAMLRKAGAQSSGRSLGDTVCVRPWDGDGYCGTVLSVDKTKFLIRVTEIVGCKEEGGCMAKDECSAGQRVGGASGIAVGDEVPTVSWCLTQTGVKQ